MRKTKLEIALPIIASDLNSQKLKIFKSKELCSFIRNNHQKWDLAKSTGLRNIIDYLNEYSNLKKIDFPFPYRHETRYVWGNISIYETLLTLHNKSYFSHESALYFNGLTNKNPKTIYLNHEQPPRAQSGIITQRGIDMAFKNCPRTTNNKIKFENIEIYIINGMSTNQLGVITKTVSDIKDLSEVRTTNIARTLIDITVRPVYSGGVEAVKSAYSLARNQVSVEALRDIYLKLKYQYPYHQAIGYYLEVTNYPASSVNLFKQLPMEFNFYLTNQIKEPEYKENWKLYVPK